MKSHKTIAILMAPFLAIASYVVTGYYFSEQTPPDNILMPTGKCQPSIQACIVESNNLSIEIKFSHRPTTQQRIPVTIATSSEVEDVLMAIGNAQINTMPIQFQAGNNKHEWQANIQLNNTINLEQLILRLVITYKGTLHFAEVPITS